uniref:G-protein coupled receptors family 1 profile domain-containing protein n=2 Tax=Acrobeloides nanus TaxID=290746 RepID=A0A914DXP0_9BILA
MCQIFTTADILLCTSSILNLCAIAIDRYWAIHDPINYAQKRTLRFVIIVIILVWILSAMISIPPLFGWNDYTSQQLLDHCELTDEKAFVVFSASGSFFLPLIVMVVIYVKIFLAARNRIRKNQQRRSAMMRIEQPPPSKNISKSRTSKIRSMPLDRKDSLKFLVERAPLIAKDGINGVTSTVSGGSDSKGSDEETKIATVTLATLQTKNGNSNEKVKI